MLSDKKLPLAGRSIDAHSWIYSQIEGLLSTNYSSKQKNENMKLPFKALPLLLSK